MPLVTGHGWIQLSWSEVGGLSPSENTVRATEVDSRERQILTVEYEGYRR